MKKRGILLVAILVLFNLISVYAQTTCSDDNTILKLSSIGNAHGELWSGINYDAEVCFSGTAPANPHDCGVSDEHLVLKLSGQTNAHAEGPLGTAYTEKVCYSALSSCELINGNCPTGKSEILLLSSPTNAHLALSGSYTQKICCSVTGGVILPPPPPPPTPGTEDAYWANMRNVNNLPERIDDNGIVFIGNKVRLVARGAPDGEVIFEIYDLDNRVFDTDDSNIRTRGDALRAASSGGRAIVEWEITEEDYQKGLGLLDEENDGDDLELYFKAAAPGYEKTSQQIILQKERSNREPIAIITNPVQAGVYVANQPINFAHESYDIDGNIVSVKWKIGSEVREQDSFQYTFNSAGSKLIELEVKDNQNAIGSATVEILVLGDIKAFISKPKENDVIVNDDRIVEYDGRNSFIVKVNARDAGNCPTSITCIRGNCPSQSEAHGACSAVNIDGDRGNYNGLNFKWFFEGNRFEEGEGEIYSHGDNFYSSSNSLNDKNIKLDLRYSGVDPALTDSITHSFTVGQCLNGGRQVLKEDPDYPEVYHLVSTTDYISEGIPNCAYRGSLQGPSCCPVSNVCQTGTDNRIGCHPVSTEEEGCKAYNSDSFVDIINDEKFPSGVTNRNEYACNEDLSNQVRNDLSWDEDKCGNDGEYDCICEWNNNECKFNKEPKGTDPVTRATCVDLGDCFVDTQSNEECDENTRSINVNVVAVFEPDPANPSACRAAQDDARLECESQSGSKTIACPKPSIKLPFFGAWQFLVSLIVLVTIYLVLSFIRRKNFRV